ncbi:MAG: glycosyltransferase [Flavobacteriales bacterium]|nr:glycosyltransferase [Flavobacteriales bacterium]MBK6946403.1 glycosyltransferase [Flavobacteriales bacterium]MBK7238639.1 glycosyltransferase [Flavobacteriales bacterium]MBK7298001.1 glycosyltransferase [Flavobacteriales bacterium]MBK9536452.1 glycosyltransferase [Flavobacteriales bacterium]
MHRVLIITYYWPPNGGAGVYRWLKFSKYLPQNGWQPVIYTPQDPELVSHDPDLSKDIAQEVEVVRQPITEPFSLYKRFTGRKQEERVQTAFLNEGGKRGWKDDVALWIRSNLFIPDARVWWVKPSIKFLTNYLKEHPVDAIITTGPPHSMHLIGLGLKRATGIKWVADFRDPWTDIDYYGQLTLTKWADKKQHRLEREVLQAADKVVTVSWSWAKDLEQLGGRPVEVITNGYDPADVPNPSASMDDAYSLVHIGSMVATRDCPELWNTLGELVRTDGEFADRFVLRFVGPVDLSVIESATSAGLGEHIERMGRVGHAEAMREMQRARVLLLPINDTPNSMGILPGKVFEYLSVGRPILAVGPKEGDIARVLGLDHLLISRTGAKRELERIKALFATPMQGHQNQATNQFSRPSLANEVAELLQRTFTAQNH